MSKRETKEAGFTLIELLIVVAVVGIVAAISVVSYFTALDKSKQADRGLAGGRETLENAPSAAIMPGLFAP